MVYEQLYDWQKKIIDSIQSKHSYGLFLKMGLGKTPLSIAACERHDCDKLIIISVNSKASEDEKVPGSFLWWCKKSNIYKDFEVIRKNSKPEACKSDKKQILIINYEALFKRSGEARMKGDLKPLTHAFAKACTGHRVGLIIDESHKLKNYSSIQTTAVLKLQKYLQIFAKSLNTYLLTGTPFTIGFIDLWTQLKVLGCPMTKAEFINRFCIRGEIRNLWEWQQPIVAYKNVDELFEIVHRYAITIDTDEVIQLPEQIFITHSYDETLNFKGYTHPKMKGYSILELAQKWNIPLNEIEYQTNHLLNNPFYRCASYPDLKWMAEETGVFWMRCRQMSIGFQGNKSDDKWFDETRLTMLSKFLEDNPDNYVLFYSYTSELLRIYDICSKLGYKIDVYCGEIKSLANYEQYAALPSGEKLVSTKNIIIANYQSGSTGTNWQEYSNMILFDLPVYKDYAQGIERIHRIGQKRRCVYHLFTQNNWLDNGMLKALQKRIDYTEDTFNSDRERIEEVLKGETV